VRLLSSDEDDLLVQLCYFTDWIITDDEDDDEMMPG
jgi:hypothetical protein